MPVRVNLAEVFGDRRRSSVSKACLKSKRPVPQGEARRRNLQKVKKPPAKSFQRCGGGDAKARRRCSHREFDKRCPACVYARRRLLWERTVGSHQQQRDGIPGRLVWLKPKPIHWGGGFALGCVLCHRLAMMSRDLDKKKTRRRLTSKWSRFEITGIASMQSSCLRLHQQSALHKLALEAWSNPGVGLWRVSCLVAYILVLVLVCFSQSVEHCRSRVVTAASIVYSLQNFDSEIVLAQAKWICRTRNSSKELFHSHQIG